MRTNHGVTHLTSARLSQVPRVEAVVLLAAAAPPPSSLSPSSSSPTMMVGDGAAGDSGGGGAESSQSSPLPTAAMGVTSSSALVDGGSFIGGEKERRGVSTEGMVGIIFAVACVLSFAGHRHVPRLLGWRRSPSSSGSGSRDVDGDDGDDTGAKNATKTMKVQMKMTRVVPSPSETAMRLPPVHDQLQSPAPPPTGALHSVAAVGAIKENHVNASSASSPSPAASRSRPSPRVGGRTGTTTHGSADYSAAAMAFARQQREEQRRLRNRGGGGQQQQHQHQRQQPSGLSFEQRLALHNSKRAAHQSPTREAQQLMDQQHSPKPLRQSRNSGVVVLFGPSSSS